MYMQCLLPLRQSTGIKADLGSVEEEECTLHVPCEHQDTHLYDCCPFYSTGKGTQGSGTVAADL